MIELPAWLLEFLKFWAYDTVRIVVLIAVFLLAVNYLSAFLSPKKISEFLKDKGPLGYIGAAFAGTISPFCSCSSIPLFLGFLRSGVPFGATMTFLFASPMINLAAVPIFLAMLGWRITVFYIAIGIFVSITAGWIIENMGFEVERGSGDIAGDDKFSKWKKAKQQTKVQLKELVPYVVAGTAIGAAIHGFVPTSFIERFATGSFAVLAGVLIGIPVYANVFAIIPIVAPLIDKGMPMPVAIAFMLSATGLSLPEFIILSKVLDKKILATFISLIAIGILATSYLLYLV